MTENELHDPKQPPRLKSLDLSALGAAIGADAEGMVCDIDDPDCEAPAAPTSPASSGSFSAPGRAEPVASRED